MAGSLPIDAGVRRASETPLLIRIIAIAAILLVAFFAGYEVLERAFLAGRLSQETLHRLHVFRGIIAAALCATFVGWALTRNHSFRVAAPSAGWMDRTERVRAYLGWLIELRWLAVASILLISIVAVPLTHLLPAPSFWILLAWCMALAAANVWFSGAVHSAADVEAHALLQIATDLVVLTGLLNASGGVENPLAVTYVFHVVIAGIVLPKKRVFQVTLLAAGLLMLLVYGELLGLLPHVTNLLFPHHVELGAGHSSAGPHAAHNALFVAGRALPLAGVFFLTSYFVTLVVERLRSSERELESAAATELLHRQRLEGLIEAASVGMVVVTGDLTIGWANERAREWLPLGDSTLLHAHDGGAVCPACLALQTFESGAPREEERTVAQADGGSRAFRCATFPIHNRDGELVQVVQLVEDITQRKALEYEAMHAGKLAVLGQLAAGIAHEIGNPLTSLDTRLRLLLHRRGDEAFFEESVSVLREQIERMGRIVRGVSRFARSGGDHRVECDLREIVEEAVRLVVLDSRAANVRITTVIPEQAVVVRGLRDQLLQVVVNLLINAVEAMPDGGNVEVRIANGSDHVSVIVRDEGAGIDYAARERLFHPFFTTKPNGTGLGLSICHTLVSAHGGTIQLRPASPGAEAIVRLPIAEDSMA